MIDWFARPILHVSDVEAAIRFYVDQLGFTEVWRHEDGGALLVAQVDRAGCALILAGNLSDRAGGGAMFISLNAGSKEAQARALDALRDEFTSRGAEVGDGRWGYRVLVVADPDGNTLMFNYTD